MILHVLNASPASAAFSDCVSVIQSCDALVLIGDGVYAALAGTQAHSALIQTGSRVYLLRKDAIAAGVSPSSCGIEVIDIDGLVTLTEQFQRQICWH